MADEKTTTATDRAREYQKLDTPIVPPAATLTKCRVSRLNIDPDAARVYVELRYASADVQPGDVGAESPATAVISNEQFELASTANPPMFQPIQRWIQSWDVKKRTGGGFNDAMDRLDAPSAAGVLAEALAIVKETAALPDLPAPAYVPDKGIAEKAAALAADGTP